MIALALALSIQTASPPQPVYFCMPGPGLSLADPNRIDGAAEAILDNAASGILHFQPRPRIQLMGLADAGVPRAEGLRLALRRAMAVRAQLVLRGVPPETLFVALSDRNDGLDHWVGIYEIVTPAEGARRETEREAFLRAGGMERVC